jgi:hypothetical protein
MKVQIFAVSCGPIGLFQTWLDNQRWALEEHDVSFRIGVHSWMVDKLPLSPDIEYVVADEATGWTDFWGDGLLTVANTTEVVGLSQMDCIWWRKPTDVIETARAGIVCTTRYMADLHVKDAEGKMVFPRFWEGGAFVSADTVREWQSQGVREGLGKTLIKENPELWSDIREMMRDFKVVRDSAVEAIRNNRIKRFSDPFFEVTLWCAKHRMKYLIHDSMLHLEAGDRVGFNYKGELPTVPMFFNFVERISDDTHGLYSYARRWPFMLFGLITGGLQITREQFDKEVADAATRKPNIPKVLDRTRTEIMEAIESLPPHYGVETVAKLREIFA